MRNDAGLLILRLTGLGLALAHGWGKLVALSTGQGQGFVQAVAGLGFPAPTLFAWAAALSEFAGGLLLALGLGTRIAAGFAAATMAVAAFVRHRAAARLLAWLGIAPVSDDTLKAWGNPELALLFLAVLLAIALLGPGRFSLDRLVRRKS